MWGFGVWGVVLSRAPQGGIACARRHVLTACADCSTAALPSVSMHVRPCLRMHACSRVQLRPSMTKFDSPHSALEVVGIARFNPGYLNRQIVLLLRTLGVREKVVHRPSAPPSRAWQHLPMGFGALPFMF